MTTAAAGRAAIRHDAGSGGAAATPASGGGCSGTRFKQSPGLDRPDHIEGACPDGLARRCRAVRKALRHAGRSFPPRDRGAFQLMFELLRSNGLPGSR